MEYTIDTLKISCSFIFTIDKLATLTQDSKTEIRIQKFCGSNTLKLIFGQLPAPYTHPDLKVSDPNYKVGLGFVGTRGMKAVLGQNSAATVLLIENMAYKRITYSDIGLSWRSCGLYRQTNNKLVWYLKKLDLSSDIKDTLWKRLVEESKWAN